MTMSNSHDERIAARIRDEYHVPPPTPRDEMWDAISGRIDARGPEVIDLGEARRARSAGPSKVAGWAVAAAAVLMIGIGIGRGTAPQPVDAPLAATDDVPSTLSFAAQETLGRSETLLTMVREDVREGRLDPVVVAWTNSLLSETRLLLDADIQDEAVRELLEDMELILVQLVGVMDDPASTEVELALQGMDERQVLPRIQAILPSNSGLYGT